MKFTLTIPKVIVIIPLFILALPLLAQGNDLSPAQIDRVKVCKAKLAEVDQKTFQESVDTLIDSNYPEENLQILEAIANTYADLAAEFQLTDSQKKGELYSLISLNMAYFQFGGQGGGHGSSEPLYRRIRNTLKKYVSPELMKDPRLFTNIDYWEAP